MYKLNIEAAGKNVFNICYFILKNEKNIFVDVFGFLLSFKYLFAVSIVMYNRTAYIVDMYSGITFQ